MLRNAEREVGLAVQCLLSQQVGAIKLASILHLFSEYTTPEKLGAELFPKGVPSDAIPAFTSGTPLFTERLQKEWQHWLSLIVGWNPWNGSPGEAELPNLLRQQTADIVYLYR